MSANNNDFDMFDPTGMVKGMRDASLDAWAKSMVEIVNSQAYAEATGAMLDAWLSSSAPFRKVTESAMAQAMASLKIPSRDDISQLSERLTHIEMRLDDMDAKLDDALRAAAKKSSQKKSKASNEGSDS